MTVASIFTDLMLLGTFLLAGFIIREILRPLQKLFIPTAVIGGALALVLGPQVLDVVAIPKSFDAFSGVLINLIMTAIVLGISVNKDRMKSFVDYTAIISTTYGLQLALGVLLGMGLSLLWDGLPKAWGIMGVFSFWGGHGTAAATGEVFRELGVQDNYGMGMILSTIGLMVAIIVGMGIANWGLRNGKTHYFKVDSKMDESVYRGPLPADKRKSIGTETVSSAGINSLALQLSLMLFCMFVGGKFFAWVKTETGANIPNIVHGMIVAILIWPIITKMKWQGYVDKASIHTLSSVALELVICAAVATLPLQLVTDYFVPILIYSAILVPVLIFANMYVARKVCAHDWFEKGITAFGQGTGNTSTGLALLRCVDPDTKSSAMEACGIGTSLFIPIYGLMPAFAPVLAMQSEWYIIGIGIIIMVTTLILSRFFLWQK